VLAGTVFTFTQFNMPNLLKKWFKQAEEINSDTVKRLETASFRLPVGQVLAKLGWDASSLVAGIGLELSPDNRRVIRGQFFLRGQLERETITLQANNLWPAADAEVKMHITMPDGYTFRFNSGTLCSDMVACEDYKHYFTRGDNIIPPTDWGKFKLGETAIRAVCHLDKSSNGASGPAIKTTVLIFPRSVEEMMEISDHTQSPAWPGLRILEAQCAFAPDIGQWKDPACPIFMTGSPLTDAPNAPSIQEIRHRIAAVMRSAKRPTACTSGKALKTQWNKAINDVEALERDPTITWPAAPRQPAEQGNN